MVVADATSVNTGAKNEIVPKTMQPFDKLHIERPIFISCQHHFLDRILKHAMDQYLGSTKSTSAEFSYDFVTFLQKNYSSVKSSYLQSSNHLQVRQYNCI